MEEVKRIPYGVSNFVEVVEQNQYYVDKTMYLPLLEKQHSCKGLSKYSFLISPEWEGLTERLPKTLMITVAADWMILLLSMNPIIIPALKRK